MKKKLFLLVVALLAMGQSAFAYDFSAVSPSGHTLYYKIIDSVNHYVALTYPNDSQIDENITNPWDETTRWGTNIPTGSLILPDTVSYNGTIYTVRVVSAWTFSHCPILSVVMSNTIDSLGRSAFEGCTYLSNVTYSNTLRYIGENALRGCMLGTVVLPSSVRVLDVNALRESHITSITLNDSLEVLAGLSLAANPFSSLYIPASVREFGTPCWYMSNLTTIVVDPNNPYFDSRNNCNAVLNTMGEVLQACNNSVFPEGTTRLWGDAFRWCNFGTLVIPSTVRLMGFFDCHIDKLIISSPMIGIDSWGFADTIQFLTENPPISLYTYNDGDGLYDHPIIVPCNAVSAYQSAPVWSNFTNISEAGIHKVTVQSGEHGTASVVQPTCANPNATLTATPDEGYHFTHWNDGNQSNPRTVAVTSDSTFTANFAINQYTVTVLTNDATMGTATGGGVSTHGSTRTVSATANYGYHFTGWSDGESNISRTITVISDTTLTANFAINQYSVTLISNNTTLGTVSGEGICDHGSSRTITATPSEGCHFVRWNDGDLNATRTITVTSDITLTAYFALNTYLVTVVSDNTVMGSAVGGGTVFHNNTCNVVATANYGYHFTGWSDGNSSAMRTITVTSDSTLTAYFANDQFTITVLSNNTAMGTVTGSGVNDYNTTTTIIATANYGYHFTHWSDGDSTATRSITVICDSVLTAYFAVNQYTLSVESNDDAIGTVTGGGNFTHGTQATVTATALNGHRFDHWSNGSQQNPYTFTMLDNLSLSALFVEIQIDTVTILDTTYIDVHDTTYINIHDTIYIDTLVVDNYIYDTTVLIQTDTVVVDNYITDTLTITDTIIVDNYLTDTLYLWDTLYLTDTIYIHDTVYIHDSVGVDDVETVNYMVYTTGSQIVIEGAEQQRVILYDITGRMLATKQSDFSTIRFDISSSGTYLIKVGNLPARKIVVVR